MDDRSSNNPIIYLKLGALPIACDLYLGGHDDYDFQLIESHYDSIIKNLKEADVITEIDAPKKCKWSSFIIDESVSIYFRDAIKLCITLPARLHHIALIHKDWLEEEELDLASKYNLLYDGICFAYFREITNEDAIPSGASDAREQLKEILKDFTVIRTFPSPLRQSIIIRTNPNVRNIETKRELDDLIIDISTDLSATDVVYEIFYATRLFLMYLYDGTHMRERLQQARHLLQTRVQEVLSVRKKLQAIPWYYFYAKNNFIKDLENKCTVIVEELGAWYSLAHELENKRRLISEHSSYPLDMLEDSLLKDLTHDPLQTEHILKVVDLAQDSIDQQNSLKHVLITAFAALVAAIIGALIGGFWASK